ncbi:outer membrane beta-barrel protein [Psychromonas sp. B3M02]|uniref:outer membrane beta-barrel protein n=1 Tax=Psychromonas sp. B3M02 TaxID=2267226 RepID=UPI0015F0308D|nr:outer membrane beta-barrel protein [Psychromonas sp. B3M02]
MKYSIFLAISPVFVINAFAESFDPAPIKVTDGFMVVPQVSASVKYDDNIYDQEDDTTSSAIYIVTPSIKFGVDDGINRYGGSYRLTSASYENGSEDNYTDHTLSLLAHTEYTDRHRTDFSLSYANLHEDRGSGLSEGNSSFFDQPIKYNELNARGYYQFGGLNAIMRIGGGVNFSDVDYRNFIVTTRFDDVSKLTFFADADYQAGNVTYLTFDVSTTDVQYDELEVGQESGDNRDSSALVGFRWLGLGKTTATAKVGYQYKTFESESRENFSGNTVELGATWKPQEYSTFDISFSRAAEDSSTVGDYILEINSGLAWKQSWTEDFDTSLSFSYTDEDYIGFSRNDKTKNLALNLNYTVTRWIKLQAGYQFTDKNSTETDISYDKNAVNLGIVVAL